MDQDQAESRTPVLLPRTAAPAKTDRAPQMALQGAVERLARLIDAESAALSARAPLDLQDFATRKSRGLLELTRLLQGQDAGPENPALRDAVMRLKDKLDANRALLQLHLEAVQELAGIIAGTMRDAESDGTYSAAARRAANAA